MVQINRYRKEWEQSFIYECSECKSKSETISNIEHEADCSLRNPDDVKYPFASDETKELINNIINEVRWRLETVEYVKDLDSLTDIRGVKWDSRGSSNRIAVGLGQTTHKGAFHLDNKKGIVLKIDPLVRWGETTPVSGNIDELFTWEKAVETETESLFAEVITHSKDGLWLIMEECIPIYKSRGSLDKNRDSLFDSGGKKYINPLIKSLSRNNWYNPDYKYGNIGLNDDEDVVVLDYGTGPNYKSD